MLKAALKNRVVSKLVKESVAPILRTVAMERGEELRNLEQALLQFGILDEDHISQAAAMIRASDDGAVEVGQWLLDSILAMVRERMELLAERQRVTDVSIDPVSGVEGHYPSSTVTDDPVYM